MIRALPDAAATEALAREIALVAWPGGAILLSGDLGAGKSTFARAFIHALAGRGDFDVPSPTFTLVQAYDRSRIPVAHADLYRLKSAEEAEELDFPGLLADHVLLVEWPDRLDRPPTDNYLGVTLGIEGEGRVARLEGRGAWAQALDRAARIAAFLPEAGWGAAARTFLEGDASSRRYERLALDGRDAILMDMPARPDGPPVRDGLPYSRIAHLAEDIRAVAGVGGHLLALGYSAPVIHAKDEEAGLAIIENLGDRVYGRMMAAGADMDEPQRAAVALLADMAARDWPEAAGGHHVPRYDERALGIETELAADWFWPYRFGRPVPEAVLADYRAAWAPLLRLAQPDKPVWCLRDYHSPNLIWMPEREGVRRVGLIDTQDAVRGHPAYDVVSMLQDARVTIPEDAERALLDHYCRLRRGFDEAEFRAAYAILGAQRASKLLGIFTRLSKRDGKHGYLKHLPRVSAYLDRNLAHPVLKDLARWYAAYLPASLRESAP